MKLSPAEQYNYEWLTSVIQKDSGYTQTFKYYAQLHKEKFERKMRKTINTINNNLVL